MDLRTRAIKATGWYLATRLFTQVVSWGVTILLARLLTPVDYGLFGMALSVISFLELIQQFGLGAAIVQRQNLSRSQLNTIFWVVVTTSLLVATAAWASAVPVAAFYREERLVGIVRALATILLLGAIGVVPYSLLTKEIDFRRRSWAESTGVVSGTVVSLSLAWAGHGVWALVWGGVTRAAVYNAAILALSRWSPGFAVSWEGMRHVFHFGLNVTGSTVLRELSAVADSAILGRLLGGQALGLYSMAVSIGMNPLQKLSTIVINQLSFPVFAKVQTDTAQLQRYFLKVTKYLAVATLPMQLGLALVSGDLVLVLLSEKWQPIVGLLQVLCVGGIWYMLPMPAPPLLTARGLAATMLRFHALFFVVMAGAFILGARFGLAGVAVAWAVAYCALRSILVWLSLRELRLSFGSYLANLATPVSAALAMTAAVIVIRSLAPSFHDPIERLARDIVVGATVYVGVLLVRDHSFGAEVKSIMQTLVAGSRA